jgi:hypothetical protein
VPRIFEIVKRIQEYCFVRRFDVPSGNTAVQKWQVGVRAVEVDAIDDDALNFYGKYGFRSLLDDPSHLFLPIHEIRKLGL